MEVMYSIVPDLVDLSGQTPSRATGQLTIRYTATGTAPQSSTGSGFAAVPGPALLVGGHLTVRETFLYPPTGMAIYGSQLEFRLNFLPGMAPALGEERSYPMQLVARRRQRRR